MGQPLAFLLCSAFVFFLLRIDRKKAKKVSLACWIPAIWIFSIAAKPLSGWLREDVADADSGSPVDRVLVTGLLCLGLFVLSRRKLDWSEFIRKNTWLMLLIGF